MCIVRMCTCVCFLQAEDGIRYLVRSRGLGDVYKRQSRRRLPDRRDVEIAEEGHGNGARDGSRRHDEVVPVSYTHLTLPTSDLV